jgi:transcriptional accessory protein Tex/SPT6
MSFWRFLQATRATELDGLSEILAEQAATLTGRGHSVADLLSHYGDEFGHLPVEALRRLATSCRAWRAWRQRRGQLEQRRQEVGQPPLPPTALDATETPDELEALVRVAALVPPAQGLEDPAWLRALLAGVELWRASLRLARQQGAFRCRALSADAPVAAPYEAFAGTTTALSELPGHRWLALRRGERARVLALELELPTAALLEQTALYRSHLGPTVSERSDSSLLEELVLDDLPRRVLALLDQEAEQEAIQAACESLNGLLRTAPLQTRRVGALYLLSGGAPTVAVVVAERDGDLIAQRVLKAQGPWQEKAIALLQEHAVTQVVLPTSTPVAELLNSVEAPCNAAGLQLVRVRPAALAEARQPLVQPPLRLSTAVASALVIARRALDPFKEWCAVDPVGIGLAEYQSDLDADRLRAALTETVELLRLERRRARPMQPGVPVARGNASIARLNPMVRSLADLRGGMTVHGVVTNISHFGAFISIGLAQEGLVHVSELSDEFVSNPTEVVTIGQQVTARVLSVDAARGRIAMSLRTQARKGPAEGGATRAGDAGGARARPGTRAAALANLERLFKK